MERSGVEVDPCPSKSIRKAIPCVRRGTKAVTSDRSVPCGRKRSGPFAASPSFRGPVVVTRQRRPAEPIPRPRTAALSQKAAEGGEVEHRQIAFVVLDLKSDARIVHGWIEGAGMDSSAYGTHSMRRTKAAQIYRKTGNLRAVQLLLGHTKIESTVRYLGIEVDDALTLSEQVEL